MIYDQKTGKLLVSFDTYIENNYHNSNTVAFEPLENGSFSSDSKQNTPFIVSVTGIKTITPNSDALTYIPKPTDQRVDQVRTALENLNGGSSLVLIILQPMIRQSNPRTQYSQYGNVYQNMSMFSLDYQNTPEQIEFRPTMAFQQIRLTDTQYTSSQVTANPQDSDTINQGQVQPAPVQISLEYDAAGRVL